MRGLINFIKRNKYFVLIIIFVVFLTYIILPPKNFNFEEDFVVQDGLSIRGTANSLKEAGLIKSTSLFNILISFTQDNVVAGTYRFEKPQNIFTIVRRLAQGDYQIPSFIITFQEGVTVREIAERVIFFVPDFDKKTFLEIASPKEGYLFPDTYRLKDNVTSEELLNLMEDTFYIKMAEIDNLIRQSKYSLAEIVIMASIVEKEATEDSRQDVSNILWKRFEEDMLLQVDAPFVYYNGRNSFTLTMDDLREDHEYNTYVNLGLPAGPISNPGLESIKAAANPQETDFFYFLTGRDGEMYYSRNFEGHVQNRRRYLD